MADVRSLLRNERASRQISHTHASYTSSGKLICNICNTQIKTEALWDNHLRSQQHATRLQQLRDVPAPNKKRKAGDTVDEGRKRVKGVPGVPDDFFEEAGPQLEDAGEEEDDPELSATAAVPGTQEQAVDDASTRVAATESKPSAQPAPPPDIDEEWAAFQREIAAEPEQLPTTAINASATISAAPMTAEEIAAQAREEQSAQRGRRDLEIEDEKEDAANALEAEFEEMEELEERVRKLREKREALRRVKEEDAMQDQQDTLPTPTNGSAIPEDEEDDDDEEDDYDDWNFGAR